jgi:hypothetical protein
VAQSFEDIAPSGDEIMNYDREHATLYLWLLGRQRCSQDWRTTVRVLFGIDPENEPARARSVYDSHLARATWLARTSHFDHLLRQMNWL